MNLIEAQWHQLKTHEIAGRIFDNEYDLANAMIEGMENRSQQGDGHWNVLCLNLPSYLVSFTRSNTLARVVYLS
ncbi:MAG: hypothetical protein N4J56_005166 [Chroococcidiopsis sp. SAG 2025]|uniref:hypothetical protein n=1 Tax=Chroococcidiopsis sp. SAG 2025 TaxID=171389 RepID=UPI0029374978|nr:hypothetical protein [Chroococcidiopsis sp. SAG 2025]MDV2995512.1 hypothetical protein [Chroococcidiopsis sp. SAG 2025]